MQRQILRRSLLVLLGVLLMTVAWGYLRPNPGKDRQGDDFALTVRRNTVAPSRTAPLTTLQVGRLDQVRPAVVAGRDLWRFVDPPPRRTVAVTAETAGTSLPARLPEPSSQPVVVAPELPLEYLGNFGPPGMRVAVFSDGKRVRNALEGDVIDGRFRVARIGYESVEIELLGYPGLPAKRLSVRRR